MILVQTNVFWCRLSYD